MHQHFDEEGRYTIMEDHIRKCSKNVVLKHGDVCRLILTSTVLFKENILKLVIWWKFFYIFGWRSLQNKINKRLFTYDKVTYTHGQLKIKNKLKKCFSDITILIMMNCIIYLKLICTKKTQWGKQNFKYIIKMLINLLIMRIDKHLLSS